MEKIKLIATDMDGTFFEEGCPAITDEDAKLINAVIDKGYIFCACSGRPYGNMRRAFAPVADRLLFICDNGANIMYNDRCIYRDAMDRQLCYEFIDDILSLDDRRELVVCTPHEYVLMPKRDEFIAVMTNTWHMTVRTAPSKDRIIDDILKLSVYFRDGVDMDEVRAMQDKWLTRINNSFISGTTWLDFQNADKGGGLKKAAEYLGIELSEIMAFGDNYNDISMLEAAGISYAMSHSPADVQKHAKFSTPSVQEVLKGLL